MKDWISVIWGVCFQMRIGGWIWTVGAPLDEASACWIHKPWSSSLRGLAWVGTEFKSTRQMQSASIIKQLSNILYLRADSSALSLAFCCQHSKDQTLQLGMKSAHLLLSFTNSGFSSYTLLTDRRVPCSHLTALLFLIHSLHPVLRVDAADHPWSSWLPHSLNSERILCVTSTGP